MRFLAILGASALLFGQTPAPKPAPAKPAATPKTSAAKPAAQKPAATKPAPTSKPVVAKVSLDDPIVFQVGEDTLTRSQFDQFLAQLPENLKAQIAAPGGKRQLAERLAEMKALAQAARKEKVDQKPDVQQQIALQTDQVLAANYYQSLVEKAKPSEADSRKFYQEHQKDYEQAKARHILIRFAGSRVPLKEGQKDLTDAEALAKAQDLKQQIQGGKSFAEVAKAESDDTGSGANGGDLGTFGHGRMVPQFEEAVFSQELNKISEPVKSQFGYHLIEVQERGTRPFEQVREEIEKRSGPEEARKVVEGIKSSAHITLDPTYFPAAPTTPPLPPAANPGAASPKPNPAKPQ